MNRKLGMLAGFALLVSCGTGQADFVAGGQLWTTGTTDLLTVQSVVPPGNQPLQHPCIICGTNQPQQNSGGATPFGYNNYKQGGVIDSFAAFSTSTLAANGKGDQLADDTQGTPYLASFLRSFLISQLDLDGILNIGVDINSAGPNAGPEVLRRFAILDVGNFNILADTGVINMPLPPNNNGTGFADYFITGFNIDRGDINANTQIMFFASWINGSDGSESFFIVPQVTAVPAPIVGAGIPGMLTALAGMYVLARRRRQKCA